MRLTDTEIDVLQKMAKGWVLRNTRLSLQEINSWNLEEPHGDDTVTLHRVAWKVAEFLRKQGLIRETYREGWNTDYGLTQRGQEAAQAGAQSVEARLAAWNAWAKGGNHQ